MPEKRDELTVPIEAAYRKLASRHESGYMSVRKAVDAGFRAGYEFARSEQIKANSLLGETDEKEQ